MLVNDKKIFIFKPFSQTARVQKSLFQTSHHAYGAITPMTCASHKIRRKFTRMNSNSNELIFRRKTHLPH